MNLQATDLKVAEEIIGYSFTDKVLLQTAFTHSSNIVKKENYERLEFLGDSILDFVVGARLFKVFSENSEGELTKKRAYIVSAEVLSEIIDELKLIDFLTTAPGKSREKVLESKNVKCDLFEAIIGAIALDNNLDLVDAEKFIWRNLEKYIDYNPIDYKSKTIEYCVQNQIDYSFDIEENNDGKIDEKFVCSLKIGKNTYVATGKSKKDSEKKAAKQFFVTL